VPVMAENNGEKGNQTQAAREEIGRVVTDAVVRGLWTWISLGNPFQSRFGTIPDFFWTRAEWGSWICEGIWNLGLIKEGWNEDRPREFAPR